MRCLPCHWVRPGHLPGCIIGVPVESCCRITGVGCGYQKLVDHVQKILRPVIPESIFGIKGSSHVEAVEPHLVRVDLLVPETALRSSGLGFELLPECMDHLLIYRIPRQVVEQEDHLAGVYMVKVVVLLFVCGYHSVFVDE